MRRHFVPALAGLALLVSAVMVPALSDLTLRRGSTDSASVSLRRSGQTGAGVAPAPPPTPPPTNLAAWYKADAITGLNDGDDVTTWPDSSGNARDGTGPALLRPVYKTGIVNGLPVVRFTALNLDRIDLPNFMSAFTAAEIFVVVKIVSDTPAFGSQGLMNFQTAAAPQANHFPAGASGGLVYTAFCSASPERGPTSAVSLTTFKLFNVVSTATEGTIRLDTTQIFTTATNTVACGTTPRLGGQLVVDNTTSPPPYLDGDIAEVLIYSAALSAGDRGIAATYLDSKYALAY